MILSAYLELLIKVFEFDQLERRIVHDIKKKKNECFVVRIQCIMSYTQQHSNENIGQCWTLYNSSIKISSYFDFRISNCYIQVKRLYHQITFFHLYTIFLPC